MFGTKHGFAASFLVLFLGFSMQAHAQEGLSAKSFLGWEEQSKRAYIQTSLMTMNMIAVENDQSQAECISAWYASDRRGKEQFIYEVMGKYPDYHPVGIIMAVVEKQCGTFKYTKP